MGGDTLPSSPTGKSHLQFWQWFCLNILQAITSVGALSVGLFVLFPFSWLYLGGLNTLIFLFTVELLAERRSWLQSLKANLGKLRYRFPEVIAFCCVLYRESVACVLCLLQNALFLPCPLQCSEWPCESHWLLTKRSMKDLIPLVAGLVKIYGIILRSWHCNLE